MTQRSLAYLDKVGVHYRFIDIEEDDEAAAWVRNHNNGKEKKPTIDVNGEVVSEPTDRELADVLREQGLAG